MTTTLLKKKEVMPHLRTLDLEGAFNDLLDIISVSESLCIKARDLMKIFGIENHCRLTRLGMLLAELARLGLAKQWNRRRPRRYSLTPVGLWRQFKKRCGTLPRDQRFRCTTDGSLCGLISECPYWKVKETLARRLRPR